MKDFVENVAWFSLFLLIPGALAVAGYFFDSKASILAREGLVAKAEYYHISYDILGNALEAFSDDQTKRSSSQRSHDTRLKLHYRYTAEDGQVLESYNIGNYSSLGEAKEAFLGTEFEVVYLASDPSVHETRVGHTRSQTNALYILAYVALAFWFAIVIWALVKQFLPQKKTLKQRLEEHQAAKNE